MIDYTRMIIILIRPPTEVLTQEFKKFLYLGFEFAPRQDKHRINYYSNFRNLRLKISGDRLLISGSLCKAYHECNYKNLTFTQLNKLKLEIENTFQVSASQIQVTRIEYGLVADVTNSDLTFSNFGNYKFYPSEKMRDDGRIYGINYENSTHRLKIYDKSYEVRRYDIFLDRKLLRLEKVTSLRYLRKSKTFSGVQLTSLEDLCKEEVQRILFHDLITAISKIEFLDLKKMTGLSVRELRVYSYMNNEAIRKIVSKNFKTAYVNDKRVYQKCLQKLESKTFNEFLKQLYKLKETLFSDSLLAEKKGTNIKTIDNENQ